ncbi:FepA family TonB-dependent siderophore receptor [uncultured Stenotrophomonas sp.]|uniref:FepA family TonB-dependent siderophore receptor n=1 Tax=uncultured Stenotrophomonas sp. TaxID=165438 RepID=UPI0025E43A11|nr:FepA family TonB-dependent siderophore receptor [uncultured Stenotrophomonas sp.]
MTRHYRSLISHSNIAVLAAGTALTLVSPVLASTQDPKYQATDASSPAPTFAFTSARDVPTLETVVSTAEWLKQAPGVSTITTEDIERNPITNDISELVRKQPGVNLTGNTSTGQRGNNRQINIRGMGPENTLILVDGKPILSRDSVRMSVQGERDTRGDSNWVPAEAIESIEVLRGPAAVRYGSGAAGGVVNIRTKVSTAQKTNVSVFTNVPKDSSEGGTKRVNIVSSGPISDAFSYRVYGSFNETDNDDLNINPNADQNAAGVGFMKQSNLIAGREGLKNRDLSGRLTYLFSPNQRVDLDASWSRQGNKFAADSLNAVAPTVSTAPYDPASRASTKVDPRYLDLVGKETNRITRSNIALTHFGRYSFGNSESYVQYEHTANERYAESLGGVSEGSIEFPLKWNKTRLSNLSAKSEFNVPLHLGVEQMLTAGVDYRSESMNDPGSIRVDLEPGFSGNSIPISAAARTSKSTSKLFGAYLEDNIYVTDALVLTPGVRYNHDDRFGGTTTPSLNASWQITEQFTLKGGIARAYKAPNLYQLNPNYVYNSAGIGCWQQIGPCYVIGNPGLKPEISINKEIGLSFRNDAGWAMSLTYFHNSYRNRIGSGRGVLSSIEGEPNFWDPAGPRARYLLQQWENSGPATVAGVEGSLVVPLHETLTWSSNFTYMSKSEDDQGQPLSLIPKHTINTWLDWQATPLLGFSLGVTNYGKTQPRKLNLLTGRPENDIDLPAFYGDPLAIQPRRAYTLVNLGVNYRINSTLRLKAGVKNLLDKQLKRTHNVGANSYNEPGLSYYIGLNASF